MYTCYVLSHVQLCRPPDYSLPVSSIHGTFQAIILEWFACICECIKRFIIRHWFMWLWRLTNPKIWSPNLETQERQWYRWSQQPQDSGGASILVQDQKTGKIQCSTSKARRQEEFSLIWGKFSLFFFPTRPSSDWMRPTYIWEGNLLYLVSHNQFKCYVQVCSVMADSLQTHGL